MDRLISEQEVLDVIASWFESIEQQKIMQGRIKAISSPLDDILADIDKDYVLVRREVYEDMQKALKSMTVR